MRCGVDCPTPTKFQAHCSDCHRTFGGITGFDLHRRNGECIDPSTFDYVCLDGVWRTKEGQEAVTRFRTRVAGKEGRRRRSDASSAPATPPQSAQDASGVPQGGSTDPNGSEKLVAGFDETDYLLHDPANADFLRRGIAAFGMGLPQPGADASSAPQ
jgi:hypothetical protein